MDETISRLAPVLARAFTLTPAQEPILTAALAENLERCLEWGVGRADFFAAIDTLTDLLLHPGDPVVTCHACPDGTRLVSIQRDAGATAHVLVREGGALFVDCGFTRHSDGLFQALRDCIPGLDRLSRQQVLTHTDLDHAAVFAPFSCTFVTRPGYQSYACEQAGLPGIRERTPNYQAPYTLFRLLGGYAPPALERLRVIGGPAPAALAADGHFGWNGLEFALYQGPGGHVGGELVLAEPRAGLVITGDLHINHHEMLPRQREFCRVTELLVNGADCLPDTARAQRRGLKALIGPGSWTVCPGHGALTHWDI